MFCPKAVQVTREVMRRDRSRLVIAASGWNDFEVTLRIVGSLVNDELVVVVFGPWGNFILSKICV